MTRITVCPALAASFAPGPRGPETSTRRRRPDGTITRCFGPDQARELFGGAGLRVNWIRSRTVFSESVVTHWLRRDPGGLSKLVRAELAARSDESLGAQLVISASKPRPPAPKGPGQGGMGGRAAPP
jgi:hypothetical protein